MTVSLPPIAEIAARLGGEVRSGEVQCPGPGHSTQDRSLSVKLDKDSLRGSSCTVSPATIPSFVVIMFARS